ncbi:MAG TPA: alanyl-tRNA synthetase [Chitinophagales bacterium]|nr:alanyl-tRNA synthetase [Chitinophagales bacterium]HRK27259.1 alanyl-tRNA synthetase [Chitinophagales bacterium]
MNTNPRTQSVIVWLKRVGVAGFLFFFIKGLVWIGIFLFAAKSCNG